MSAADWFGPDAAAMRHESVRQARAAIDRSNLTTALFSMARRAAYWRWAYRDARHESRNWEAVAGNWRDNAHHAVGQARELQRPLREIAHRDCLWYPNSSCIERGLVLHPCSTCVARKALGWPR